jgi:hypothetical protein
MTYHVVLWMDGWTREDCREREYGEQRNLDPGQSQ